ncbi:hypothetical protein ACJJTC_002316 [Scirpophaga incertulas]
MYKLITTVLCLYLSGVYGYFTLPGKCPDISVMETFNLADFYGKWYQAYYYSSDEQNMNNCSTLEFNIKTNSRTYDTVVLFNQSRVDRGLFHRYSIAGVSPPSGFEADLELTFQFINAPRRLTTRKYQFQVLATNYRFYATAYTCQYSPLIDKHFIYVWILSRKPILNDVSKELALKPLQQIGVDTSKIVKDDRNKCNPKYYDDVNTEPTTFRYPVAM